MNITRTKSLLIYSAAVISGAILGAALIIWLKTNLSRSRAVAMCYVAEKMSDAGNEDKAIIMLSQASLEDRKSYVPWELLAQIYSHQGKTRLALELYETALDRLNHKGEPSFSLADYSWERRSIQKRIDDLQKQLDLQNQTPQPK